MLSQYLMIGEITKPQGVRGEVKVRPCTCDPERFEGLETVYIEKEGGYAPLAVTVNRLGTDAVFMSVAGVTDRDMAEKLRGTLLYIDRAHAVELDGDSNFLTDLYGRTACGAWWTTGGTWESSPRSCSPAATTCTCSRARWGRCWCRR